MFVKKIIYVKVDVPAKVKATVRKASLNLNFLDTGRQPPFSCKWKKTSIFLKMEDNPEFFKNGKQPTFMENGRQLHYLTDRRLAT